MRLDVKQIWFRVKRLWLAVTEIWLNGDTNAVTGETKSVRQCRARLTEMACGAFRLE